MMQRVWPTLITEKMLTAVAHRLMFVKRKQRTKRREKRGEKFIRARSKATVINLFTFLCNRKNFRKRISLDSAGLTAMECDVT
jgi:hypothetical protein